MRDPELEVFEQGQMFHDDEDYFGLGEDLQPVKVPKPKRQWQDLVFSLGSICFSIALLPAVLAHNSHVPVFTSALTGSWLWAYAYAMHTLKLKSSAVTTAMSATAWSIIYVRAAFGV